MKEEKIYVSHESDELVFSNIENTECVNSLVVVIVFVFLIIPISEMIFLIIKRARCKLAMTVMTMTSAQTYENQIKTLIKIVKEQCTDMDGKPVVNPS